MKKLGWTIPRTNEPKKQHGMRKTCEKMSKGKPMKEGLSQKLSAISKPNKATKKSVMQGSLFEFHRD